jgi:tRNA-dihydrouridine synthase B
MSPAAHGREGPRPLSVGSLRMPFPVWMAPMAGYTDAALRSVCAEMGAGMTFTEVVQAGGVARRIPITLFMLETHPAEGCVAAHMYGADPGEMADAAAVAEETGRFAAFDLNCGCPVRKIVAKGAGVALMKDPDRVFRIVEAVVRTISLPVTVKTRLGLKDGQPLVRGVAEAAQAAGASALIVHARYAEHRHGGPAEWEALAALKSELKIPLIGNGGVERPEDADRMLAETGADGVMIGRAAVGRPWIFRQISNRWNGEPEFCPTLGQRLEIVERHLRRLVDLMEAERAHRRPGPHTAEKAAILAFRGRLVQAMAGREGVKKLMRAIQTLETVDELMQRIKALEPSLSDGPLTRGDT